MTRRTRINRVLVLLVAGLIIHASETVAQDCTPGTQAACKSCGSGLVKDKACITVGKPGTVELYKWETVEEEVCVPAIRFPWCGLLGNKESCSNAENCPGNSRRGNVRRVRRLKKVKYEVDACEYEHHIKPGKPSCRLEGGLPH